ncbi:hypothetical protein KG091_05210 [Carnobacteriaceae bacterium zg-ZUI78]|nr:hypothetical protein [Carnobacteriaceae bacterium zg-ZUI78]
MNKVIIKKDDMSFWLRALSCHVYNSETKKKIATIHKRQTELVFETNANSVYVASILGRGRKCSIENGDILFLSYQNRLLFVLFAAIYAIYVISKKFSKGYGILFMLLILVINYFENYELTYAGNTYKTEEKDSILISTSNPYTTFNIYGNKEKIGVLLANHNVFYISDVESVVIHVRHILSRCRAVQAIKGDVFILQRSALSYVPLTFIFLSYINPLFFIGFLLSLPLAFLYGFKLSKVK